MSCAPLIPTDTRTGTTSSCASPANEGLRIDFILARERSPTRCTAPRSHRDERKGEVPSDHVPRRRDLDLSGGDDDDDLPMIFG